MDIQTDKCLVKRRKPSVLYGLNKADPVRVSIIKEIQDNFHLPGWRYSDEENFDLLNIRAQEIIKLVDQTKGKRILCFTHGYIMKIVIAKVLFDQNLTGSLRKEFARTMYMKNTGISEFRQVEDKTWFLWRWNDYEHLSEK